MTHLEIASLMTDYVEGTLDAARVAQASSHLEVCAECRQMVEDVRLVIAACRNAEAVEPAPWLLARIMRATIGERKPSLSERLLAWLRAAFRPQVAYSLSMAVFSVSFILFTAKVNLRSMSLRDLNPATWVYRANSRGHMLMARVEKYYYDIRFVYDVQSLIQDMRQQPVKRPPNSGKAHGSASGEASPDARNELAKDAPISAAHGAKTMRRFQSQDTFKPPSRLEIVSVEANEVPAFSRRYHDAQEHGVF